MFYIVFGVVLVFLGWIQAPYMRMMRNKKEARGHWTQLNAALRSRAGYILRVLELAGEQGILESEMEELYDLEGGCVPSDDRDVTALSAEKSVPLFDSLAEKLSAQGHLAGQEEYEFLISEIWELEADIEIVAERFNSNIYQYNEVISLGKYALQMKVLKPEAGRDFKLDRYVPQKS